MDALTCGIFFAIFISGSVFGWKLFFEWSAGINKWKNKHNHVKEYIECLILTAVGGLLYISCGIISIIYGVMLFAFIL